MTDADRLADYGHQLVHDVHRGEPGHALDRLARLDRAELEHLVVLLAASVPDEARPSVHDLVRERFTSPPRRRSA